MSTALLILVPVFALIMLAYLLFSWMVFPVLELIKCATTQSLTQGKRVLWLVLMVVSWGFGATLYALIHPASRVHRVLGIANIAFGILILSGGIWADRYQADAAIRSLDAFSSTDVEYAETLTQQQIDQLRTSQETLSSEIKASVWHEIRHRYLLSTLSKLLTKFLEDRKLSQQEYEDWMSKFSSRDVLDRHEMKEYLDEIDHAPKSDRR